MQAAPLATLDLFFDQIIQHHPVFIDYARPGIITKMVAHHRGALKWTTCGCQTLTFPYFIVFTLGNRHRCPAQTHSVTVLPEPLHSPVFPTEGFSPVEKTKQNWSLRCLHSFFISTDTSFFRFFHHIAVVSVTVCFSLRLWQTHQWRFSTAKLYSFPLQRQSDSDLIFQVSRAFRFSMLEWTMSHTSIWGIKHVPQA